MDNVYLWIFKVLTNAFLNRTTYSTTFVSHFPSNNLRNTAVAYSYPSEISNTLPNILSYRVYSNLSKQCAIPPSTIWADVVVIISRNARFQMIPFLPFYRNRSSWCPNSGLVHTPTNIFHVHVCFWCSVFPFLLRAPQTICQKHYFLIVPIIGSQLLWL